MQNLQCTYTLQNLYLLSRPGGVTAKSHRMSPQQRIGSAHHQQLQQHQHQPALLPTLPVPNYALGHPVLSAQNSSNTTHHHPHYYHHHNVIQPQNSNPITTRRRESANSSIGSVRRLLTVNRGCRHKIPVHVRAKVVKNFIFLVIGHGLISATLLPLIGLQVSRYLISCQ